MEKLIIQKRAIPICKYSPTNNPNIYNIEAIQTGLLILFHPFFAPIYNL